MTQRILLLGAGMMGANHAEVFGKLPTAEMVGVVEPRQDVGAEFAAKHGISKVFATLEDTLDWGAFDAVVNVTPDAVHHKTTMPFIAAGKHVLCEKPLATTHADALDMAKAAQEAGIVNMVNLSYRQVPAMREAARMVAAGAIGAVRYFEASYLQSWLTQTGWGNWRTDPTWLWRLSTSHGSKGVLGDVGVHILDFATFVAGQAVGEVGCTLTNFEKTAAPGNEAYSLDANDTAVMTVTLSGGAVGTVSATRYASGHLNDLHLRIYGEDGGLDIRHAGDTSVLSYCSGPNMETAVWEDIATPAVLSNQAVFVEALENGTTADPDFARGAELQAVLDAAEASDAEQGRRIAL